jgi:hypothetical protein
MQEERGSGVWFHNPQFRHVRVNLTPRIFSEYSTPLIINHDVRFGTWDLGSTSSLGLWVRKRRSCCLLLCDVCLPLYSTFRVCSTLVSALQSQSCPLRSVPCRYFS